jgi:glycosyltransferase involved in cell wall biosynthesis
MTGTTAGSSKGSSSSETKVTVGIPTYNRSRLLCDSISSVLAQSYPDFHLLISDNASEDDTAERVAAFGDERIHYSRSERNVGMVGNFNRVIESASSDFLVILPDDDVLAPDYLRSVIDVIEGHPSVGVVHSAFDVIDADGRTIEHGRALVQGDSIAVESGNRFIERSMRATWTVCWSSALFRTTAIRKAGGLRPENEPIPDFPLMMRIALDWDFAHVPRPLASIRVHADALSAEVGLFTGSGYTASDSYATTIYDQRVGFLQEAQLPADRISRYRALAKDSFRRDRVRRLANEAGVDPDWSRTTGALLGLARDEPRILQIAETWKLVVAQLGGRRAKRMLGK